MKPARCHGNRDSRAAALTPRLLTEPVLTNKRPARWRVRLRRARNFHCNRDIPYQCLTPRGSLQLSTHQTPAHLGQGVPASGLNRCLRLLLGGLLRGSLLAVLLAVLAPILVSAATRAEAATGGKPSSARAGPETASLLGPPGDAVRRGNRRAHSAARRERQHNRPDHRSPLPAPPVRSGRHRWHRARRRILGSGRIAGCRGRVPDGHTCTLRRAPVLMLWEAYRRAGTRTTECPQTEHRITTRHTKPRSPPSEV